MIPNLINTVIGIWLVYVAVLNPSLIGAGTWTIYASGLAIVVAAFWARASDSVTWYSSTNVVLGFVLLLTAGSQAIIWSEAITFWVVFWTGISVAVIALWAALYRPEVREMSQKATAR
jgi:hypothetical protein